MTSAEVAKECLALQDVLGLDVNILLFCAWLGTQSVALQREDIEAALRAVAAWQDEVVRPLRAVRQRTKAFPATKNSGRASKTPKSKRSKSNRRCCLHCLSSCKDGRCD